MKNTSIAKAGLAGIVLALVAVGMAQTNGPTGISARLGVALPTATSASDLGKTWFAGGVDYKLNSYQITQPGSGMQSYLGASVDYYSHGSTSNLPVVLNYNLRQGQIVYSVGAGIDFYNLNDLGGGTGTGFDAQAAITYELANSPTPIFFQAKYFLSGKPDLRGIGLYVGYRF